jgi:CheY-specific phosphatase CheX
VNAISDCKYNWLASQEIHGEAALYTAIAADEKTFIGFAEKYAGESFSNVDEYVKASVGEFLNLVNGLFLVNMSNNNVELELNPQVVESRKSLNGFTDAFCIPFEFAFGKIEFIISATKPN